MTKQQDKQILALLLGMA